MEHIRPDTRAGVPLIMIDGVGAAPGATVTIGGVRYLVTGITRPRPGDMFITDGGELSMNRSQIMFDHEHPIIRRAL